MASAKDEETARQDHWYLVDMHGQKLRLPKTMLFLGREECDVIIGSQSVDKRHAVLTFDLYLNQFKLKDLSTTNGTFVNNSRVPEQQYITLNHMDSIRMGHDATMYYIEQGSQSNINRGQVLDPPLASRSQDTATGCVHISTMECQGCMLEQNNFQQSCYSSRQDNKSGCDTAQVMLSQQTEHCLQVNSSVHMPDCNSSSCFPAETQSSMEQDDALEHVGTSSRATAAAHNSTARKCQMTDSVSSEAYPAGTLQAMFFVTFDDSVCNSSRYSSAQQQQASNTQLQQASNTQHFHFGDAGMKSSSRPCSLVLSGRTSSSQTARFSSMPQVESKQAHSRHAYMEIPATGNLSSDTSKNVMPTDQRSLDTGKHGTPTDQRSLDIGKHVMPTDQRSLDTGKHGTPTDQRSLDASKRVSLSPDVSKNILSTPAKSISSSLSRDSLSVSPELKQQHQPNKAQSPVPDVNPSMCFTIELDDSQHTTNRSLNISSSISQFMPSKIRKNFRQRKAMSSGASSKESTPSRNSEERELSPVSQHKLNDVWNTSAAVECRGLVKKAGAIRSPQLSSTKVMFTSRTGMASPAAATVCQYPDPTSYLIDKMFQGASSSLVRAELTTDRCAATNSSQLEKSLVRPVIDSCQRPAGLTTLNKEVHENNDDLQITEDVPGNNHFLVDRDDKLSEAGTYTIEDDMEEQEQEARRRIDQVFGVDVDSFSSDHQLTDSHGPSSDHPPTDPRGPISDHPLTDPHGPGSNHPLTDPHGMASPGGYDNVYGLSDGERTPLDQCGSSPDEDNTDLIVDEDNTDLTVGEDSIDLTVGEDSTDLAVGEDSTDLTMGEDSMDLTVGEDNTDLTVDDDYNREQTDRVQPWVEQLCAVTSHKLTSIHKADRDDGGQSVTQKPPQDMNIAGAGHKQGKSRTRTGTGRKLPSVPSDKTPVVSEQQDLLDGDRVHIWSTSDYTSVMSDHTPVIKNMSGNILDGQVTTEKPLLNSSHPHSRITNSGLSTSSGASARSHASVDTQLLLQDTETVMAAMQARISGYRRQGSQDSDMDDVCSNVAVVDGEDTPTHFTSPRQALTKRAQKNDLHRKLGSNSPGTKPVTLSYPQAADPRLKTTVPAVPGSLTSAVTRSLTSAAPRSLASAASENLASAAPGSLTSAASGSLASSNGIKTTASPASGSLASSSRSVFPSMASSRRRDSIDNESDVGEHRPTKGRIARTRTNKTFDLRRARVDSFEEAGVLRSSAGARSQSLHSNTRSRSAVSVCHSQAVSLGAEIVKRSQANMKQEKARRSNCSSDRHDQRLQRAGSLTISQAAAAASWSTSTRQTAKAAAAKPQLKQTPTCSSSSTNTALTVTGSSSSSKSQSQPGSRSASPKAAEKMAWKRRKEYDARKSVAESKAKTKDVSVGGVAVRSRTGAGSSSLRGTMIRSASFTNSAALSVHNSASDISAWGHSLTQPLNFHRAFIPFHKSHAGDRSTHSADEDDSPASGQGTARSMLSLLHTPSAFTPPLLANKPESPDITPPSKASMSLRRRTLNLDGEFGLSLAEIVDNSVTTGHKHAHVPLQATYDSLIVASIYQLSLKLRTTTDKTLNKLRTENRVSHSPSPVDDFLSSSDPSKSEMTAWKTANQELAGTLKNLRKLERHVQLMNAVIFPDMEWGSSQFVPPGQHVKQKILEDIERKFGFQPIEQHPAPAAADNDCVSPEMAEFSSHF